MPHVRFFFNHRLTGADFRKKRAWFEVRESQRTDHAQNPTQEEPSNARAKEVEVSFDFMIGADGAHSAVRFHLMKFARVSYQQEYISTLWCEFRIPPKKTPTGSDFAISSDHLHIWPAGSFMFIAIPSLDKSFTSTLFIPASHFEDLDTHPEKLVPYFQEHFPGVVPDLIPENELKKQYKENPHLPLISIKCTPYHYTSSAVILGDAAHAMVPFYGQGMNAGLEDVRVLYEHLDAHTPQVLSSNSARTQARAAALQTYTAERHPDASAINDLALRNYREMSHDVSSPLYLLRKRIEETLNDRFPSLGWATQYSRISFGNERYSEVQRLADWQGKILTWVLRVLPVLAVGLGVGVWGVWRRQKGSVPLVSRSLAWFSDLIKRERI